MRPIYRKQHQWHSRLDAEITTALWWWRGVLDMGIREKRPWLGKACSPVHLFCDARSTPPRVAAVLFVDGQIFFTDMEPYPQTLKGFRKRGDNHIMSLELLSIGLGLSSFESKIKGRNIMIFSDNTGAEHATRKGSAKEFDQGALVHAIWKKLAQMRCGAWIERVPTQDNIADLPSRCILYGDASRAFPLQHAREEYRLLRKMGASKVEPIMEGLFADSSAWAALSIQGVFDAAPGSPSC